jgi:hypothetical protein
LATTFRAAILPAATGDFHRIGFVPSALRSPVIRLQAIDKSSFKQNPAYELYN